MNKKIIILLLCNLMAFSVLAADNSTKTERNLIHEGNKLFRADNYHGALEKYEQALATNPSYQYALFNKAVTLDMLATDDNKNTENDPRKKASEIFSEIARLDTNHDLAAKSYYNLGNMAYNDEKYADAIKMYKQSLKIEPDNRACRQNLLLALQKQQEQEQNQNQEQQQEQQQQEQQQQEQQQQEQQQQQQQQQPVSQSAEQLLQAMQNKENATRRKTNQQEAKQEGRRYTDKPW